MIDLNNPIQVQQLKKSAKTGGGKLIVEFLKFKLEQFDYEKIKLDRPCQQIGEEFMAARKASKFINEIINFLTRD
jgi:hypothetical protein